MIATEEGKYRVWGGEDADTFKTINGGKGYMKIMDFEVGETITFCGCRGTRIEQRGKNAWIVKGDDVKAVVKGVDANDLDIERANARQHLSFGFGIHRCMGNRLAELQLKILWEEILTRFERIEVQDEPQRTFSSFVKGYTHLPVKVRRITS